MIVAALRALGGLTVDTARSSRPVRTVVGPRLPLSGRTVLVTGAARGLGAEVARQAHARGANVSLVGRNLAGVQQLADGLADRAVAYEADVGDLAALDRAVAQTVDRFGALDVLVANAGIAPPSDSVLTIDPVEFERTVDIDLLGQWRSVRAALPALIDASGHVVVVSSIYAFFNGALNASYAASKAGVEQLVRALRVELAGHGATAGVAYLGFVDTDLAADVFAQDHVAEARRTMPAFSPTPSQCNKPQPPSSQASKTAQPGSEHRAGSYRCCASAGLSPPSWTKFSSVTGTWRGSSATLRLDTRRRDS